MMLFLFLATLLLVLLYMGVIGWSAAGLRRLGKGLLPSRISGEKVTVVIPFRNEEERLPGILADLKSQSYPAHLWEVLLVNDHSTDGSCRLVQELTEGIPGFRCLSLSGGMSGKKEALAFAIGQANSPWILQTDADCRFGAHLISSHMSYAESQKADLVAGFVTVGKRRGGFLEAYQRLDYLALSGSGAGSFAAGRPLMCSGANLLYRKELHAETRMYDPSGKVASGDDMFLLIGARKQGRTTGFNPDPRSVVETVPEPSWGRVLDQRMRWGSKAPRYGQADMQWVALLVALTHMALLLSPLWAWRDPLYLWGLVAALAAKSVMEYRLIRITARFTGQGRSLRWFLPVWLAYYPVNGAVILGALWGRSPWRSGQASSLQESVAENDGQ